MVKHLRCARRDPMVPALNPGDDLLLVLEPDRASVTVSATPTVLRRIMLALRSGALLDEGPSMTLDEIEAEVTARWAELTARIDRLAVEAQAPRPHLTLAS